MSRTSSVVAAVSACSVTRCGCGECLKERTVFLEAALSERVKDVERVLETMEDFGKSVCV